MGHWLEPEQVDAAGPGGAQGLAVSAPTFGRGSKLVVAGDESAEARGARRDLLQD